MRALRTHGFALAALLAGTALLACKGEDPPAPPPPPCALAQLGDACAAPGECCSGNCQGPDGAKICVDAACAAVAAPCGAPSDCCSGACDSVACVDAGACGAVGAACDAPTDCCTGECGGTIGAQTCREPVTQCLPAGTTCASTSECCSPLECDPGTDRCATPSGPTCLAEGAACAGDSQCCSIACDATGHCSDAAGVCGYAGDPCSTDSDCCSQTCAGGTCSSVACRQVAQSCSDDAACCSGICGAGGLCEALPAGSTGQTCKTLGEACALPTDCCSTNCQGGACKPAASCNAFGDVCARAEDCCSGLCTATGGEPGRCDDASGGCGLDGYPCSSDSNCCTRKCVDLGTGAKVCQPSGGCRMTGNYCDTTASCCGGTNEDDPSVFNSYGVFCDNPGRNDVPPEWDSSNQGPRTCTGGQSCNPPGNICGYKASQNCCYAGGGSGKAVCKPDAGGIMRCFGGPVSTTCPTGYDANDPQCCIPTGDVCQFRDQCCGSAPCVPDAQGVLRCGAADTCMPQGSACSVGGPPTVDPCCEGSACRFVTELGWACIGGVGTCANEGEACDGSNPCCFGDCVSGTCAGSCALQGEACDGANPACCFGDCVAGTCGADCAAVGGACAADADCCSGLCDPASHLCVAACVPDAGSCTVTADCCAGLACEVPTGATSGACTAGGGGGPTCAATAQSCLTLPCCDAAETCEAGVCTPPPVCRENLQSCTWDGAECCAPLGCYALDGFEQRVACEASSVNCFCDTVTECVAMDQACSVLETCCAGYCQKDGSTATCAAGDPSCHCKPVG